MVAGSVREGNEDRRPPGRRRVEQGTGASSHNYYVRRSERVPDLVLVLDDPVPGIVGREAGEVPPAGDLVDRVRRPVPKRLDGRKVQLQGATAPPEDQDDRRLEPELL